MQKTQWCDLFFWAQTSMRQMSDLYCILYFHQIAVCDNVMAVNPNI